MLATYEVKFEHIAKTTFYVPRHRHQILAHTCFNDLLEFHEVNIHHLDLVPLCAKKHFAPSSGYDSTDEAVGFFALTKKLLALLEKEMTFDSVQLHPVGRVVIGHTLDQVIKGGVIQD